MRNNAEGKRKSIHLPTKNIQGGGHDDRMEYILKLLFFVSSRYGGERYEKRDMQTRVRERFSELQKQDEQDGQVPWHVVNAAGTIEEVQKEINSIVENTIDRVQKQEENPLPRLWQTVIKGGENKENAN
jgi:hypothetical protein